MLSVFKKNARFSFYCSGFLVTLLFLRKKPSTAPATKSTDTTLLSGSKQSISLIIYRYIRLTPVYLMVIIINTVTLK